MNNNAFYEGMLSELTKTAYVLAQQPAPKKKANNWLLPTMLGVGGLSAGYIIPKLMGQPSSTPATPPATSPTAPEPSTLGKLWNYTRDNPRAAASTVWNRAKQIPSALVEPLTHPLDDPQGFANTAWLDSVAGKAALNTNLGSKLPGAATMSKGLGAVAKGAPMLSGAADLVSAANPTNDLTGVERTGNALTGGGLIGSTALMPRVGAGLARAGGPATLAAYGAGTAGSMALDAGSDLAQMHSDQASQTFDYLDNLRRNLRSSNPELAKATVARTQNMFNDNQHMKQIQELLNPGWGTRLGYSPWTAGIADPSNQEMNQSIAKLLAQLRQQVNNR